MDQSARTIGINQIGGVALFDQILIRWSQALADRSQPSEEEVMEIGKDLLIFALADLHPQGVAEVEEEEPLFQIITKTSQQLDDQIETIEAVTDWLRTWQSVTHERMYIVAGKFDEE